MKYVFDSVLCKFFSLYFFCILLIFSHSFGFWAPEGGLAFGHRALVGFWSLGWAGICALGMGWLLGSGSWLAFGQRSVGWILCAGGGLASGHRDGLASGHRGGLAFVHWGWFGFWSQSVGWLLGTIGV